MYYLAEKLPTPSDICVPVVAIYQSMSEAIKDRDLIDPSFKVLNSDYEVVH